MDASITLEVYRPLWDAIIIVTIVSTRALQEPFTITVSAFVGSVLMRIVMAQLSLQHV